LGKAEEMENNGVDRDVNGEGGIGEGEE